MPVQKFIDAVTKGADVADASKTFATDVAETVDLAGVVAVDFDKLMDAHKDKKVGAAAFVGLTEVMRTVGRAVEAVVVPSFSKVLIAVGDKDKKISTAASECVVAITESMCGWAIPVVVPMIIEQCMGNKSKAAQKEVGLNVLTALSKIHPTKIAPCLVDLVPAVANQMWDIKKEVKAASKECMASIIECTGNKDLTPFLPVVLQAIMDPAVVGQSVESLAGCVFVQNVCAPALAVTTPVLVRGLNQPKEDVKRKCCVIIDNMCKLVENPMEVLPLLPTLEPILKKNCESISDPEARGVAEKAYKTLTKAGGEGAASMTTMDTEGVKNIYLGFMEKLSVPKCNNFDITLTYVSSVTAAMVNGNCFDADAADVLGEFLAKFINAKDATSVVKSVIDKCAVAAAPKEEEEADDDDGIDLYNGIFSLAYGSLTLLNNTKFRLKRNRFYGLLGPNNCGKTTMMRAIANEQVEGFPTRDQLRTIFVEHEIQEREVGEDEAGYPILNIDLTGIQWVVDTCNNVYQLTEKVTEEQVAQLMMDIGFGNSAMNFGKDRAADANMGVTTYSGGWKMKMQLCAATLMNADILMLDEPTGHLDVKNIAWIKDWLRQFMANGGSIIATSHDTGFLNDMTNYIVDFQDRKLKTFKGEIGNCLNSWVEKYPEKKGYFELKNDVVKFVFPKPGALEGVKSKTKAIMKMAGVNFQYPTRDTPTVMDIGLQVSQVSRVAVIGPNGAGKSTAIKLLNGELKPSSGTIWKHPNMRLAYVAQHAFQHLEAHMHHMTAVQYIMWRFAGNDDKESVEFKKDVTLTDEEEKLQQVKWFLDPKQSFRLRKCETPADEKLAVVPESLLKRKENKKEKTKEYEVKWQFKSIESTNWICREDLIKMGYIKMVQRKDEQEAAAAGLMTKPLTTQAIEKHLADFGIEPEQGTHTLLQALSGGQKVKVVLAASMWQNPHLLILDEPTNYLDRDGLGALTKAIEEYEGGVIIISHNREFANAVSQEKWIMEAGRLRREGESVGKEEEEEGNVAPEEVKDAFGNTIDVKVNKSLSSKEAKAELKKIEKKLKDHKKKPFLSDEEMWELQDRQAELQEELKK